MIPGVISHATNIVEHPELVAERIVRLAKIVGRENVIGGTDCGFAQSPFARRVHPSIMWAKLKALVEGARIATQTLWGRSSRSVIRNRECPASRGPGIARLEILFRRRSYCELGNKVAGSILTPGPMVEEIATRLMN